MSVRGPGRLAGGKMAGSACVAGWEMPVPVIARHLPELY
ncbi:hypothetical protein GJR88_02226 [Dietzia sp. DQ12-45-1b]|nr:hypothetical protein GJR88_02226 [Dietzia sp. DQ12-45-1b]